MRRSHYQQQSPLIFSIVLRWLRQEGSRQRRNISHQWYRAAIGKSMFSRIQLGSPPRCHVLPGPTLGHLPASEDTHGNPCCGPHWLGVGYHSTHRLISTFPQILRDAARKHQRCPPWLFTSATLTKPSMGGRSRWQSAVVGSNGAWRARMRTMNLKSNRTFLYRRSDRGPVLRRVDVLRPCWGELAELPPLYSLTRHKPHTPPAPLPSLHSRCGMWWRWNSLSQESLECSVDLREAVCGRYQNGGLWRRRKRSRCWILV